MKLDERYKLYFYKLNFLVCPNTIPVEYETMKDRIT